jgi:hypothetical protein
MPRLALARPAAIALAVSALLAGGCSLTEMRPGGNMRSNDRFTWQSKTYEPYTITLVDTRTGEEFWAMDVPVGQKLTVQFYENKAKQAPPETPAMMRWELIPETQKIAPLRNTMNVPPAHARRIDVSLRTIPEFPPAPRVALPEIPPATAGVAAAPAAGSPNAAPVTPAAPAAPATSSTPATPTPVATPSGPSIQVQPLGSGASMTTVGADEDATPRRGVFYNDD